MLRPSAPEWWESMATRIPLTPDDERNVLHAISGWKLRNRCLIEFGLRTGFRASEIGSLTIGQIWNGTRVRDEVTISRRYLKGGRGLHRQGVRSRTVPLAPAVRTLIHDYIQERLRRNPNLASHEPVFRSTQTAGGIGRWMINALVKRACAQAGLPQNGRYGSHTLRKSFAQRIYRATGHDINLTRAALGHRDIATSQRYLTVSEDEIRAAILAVAI
ncbi:MAG: tyrosine-type recombinase/integrase [Opitutae bacterium]|nr:tyrosine-type recombinase/integrase [Opitutae bacterium]